MIVNGLHFVKLGSSAQSKVKKWHFTVSPVKPCWSAYERDCGYKEIKYKSKKKTKTVLKKHFYTVPK